MDPDPAADAVFATDPSVNSSKISSEIGIMLPSLPVDSSKGQRLKAPHTVFTNALNIQNSLVSNSREEAFFETSRNDAHYYNYNQINQAHGFCSRDFSFKSSLRSQENMTKPHPKTSNRGRKRKTPNGRIRPNHETTGLHSEYLHGLSLLNKEFGRNQNSLQSSSLHYAPWNLQVNTYTDSQSKNCNYVPVQSEFHNQLDAFKTGAMVDHRATTAYRGQNVSAPSYPGIGAANPSYQVSPSTSNEIMTLPVHNQAASHVSKFQCSYPSSYRLIATSHVQDNHTPSNQITNASHGEPSDVFRRPVIREWHRPRIDSSHSGVQNRTHSSTDSTPKQVTQEITLPSTAKLSLEKSLSSRTGNSKTCGERSNSIIFKPNFTQFHVTKVQSNTSQSEVEHDNDMEPGKNKNTPSSNEFVPLCNTNDHNSVNVQENINYNDKGKYGRKGLNNAAMSEKMDHSNAMLLVDKNLHNSIASEIHVPPTVPMPRERDCPNVDMAEDAGTFIVSSFNKRSNPGFMNQHETSHHDAMASKQSGNPSAMISELLTGRCNVIVDNIKIARKTAHYNVMMPQEMNQTHGMIKSEKNNFQERGQSYDTLLTENDDNKIMASQDMVHHNVMAPQEIGQYNVMECREMGLRNVMTPQEIDHQSYIATRGANPHNVSPHIETGNCNAMMQEETDHIKVKVPQLYYYGPAVPGERMSQSVEVPREINHRNVMAPSEKGHHILKTLQKREGASGIEVKDINHHIETGHFNTMVQGGTEHIQVKMPKLTYYGPTVPGERMDQRAQVSREINHRNVMAPSEKGHHNLKAPQERGDVSICNNLRLDTTSHPGTLVCDSETSLPSYTMVSSEGRNPPSAARLPSTYVKGKDATFSSEQNVIYFQSCNSEKDNCSKSSTPTTDESMDPFAKRVFDDICMENGQSSNSWHKDGQTMASNQLSSSLSENAAREGAKSMLLTEFHSSKDKSTNSKDSNAYVKHLSSCDGYSGKQMSVNDISISENELYKCELCDGLLLDSAYSMICHYSILHTEMEMVFCPHCHATVDKYRIIRHIELRHRASQGLRFFCGGLKFGWKCFASFDSLHKLWMHINSHHWKETIFHCEQCEKRFETIQNFVLHYESVATVETRRSNLPFSARHFQSYEISGNLKKGYRITDQQNKHFYHVSEGEQIRSEEQDICMQSHEHETDITEGLEKNERYIDKYTENMNENCDNERKHLSEKYGKIHQCIADDNQILKKHKDSIHDPNHCLGDTSQDKKSVDSLQQAASLFLGDQNEIMFSAHASIRNELAPNIQATAKYSSRTGPGIFSGKDGVMIKIVPRGDKCVETISASPFAKLSLVPIDPFKMIKKRKMAFLCHDPIQLKKDEVDNFEEVSIKGMNICRSQSKRRKKESIKTRSQAKLFTPKPLPLHGDKQLEEWNKILFRNKDIFDDESNEPYPLLRVKNEDLEMNGFFEKRNQNFQEHEEQIDQAGKNASTPVDLNDLYYTCCFCSLTYNSIVLFRLHLSCHASSQNSQVAVSSASRIHRCGLCDLSLECENSCRTAISKCSRHKLHHSGETKNAGISTTISFRNDLKSYSPKITEDPKTCNKSQLYQSFYRGTLPSYEAMNTHYHSTGIKSQSSFLRSVDFYGGQMVPLYPIVQMCRNNPLMSTK